jgi:hypothetical protein
LLITFLFGERFYKLFLLCVRSNISVEITHLLVNTNLCLYYNKKWSRCGILYIKTTNGASVDYTRLIESIVGVGEDRISSLSARINGSRER